MTDHQSKPVGSSWSITTRKIVSGQRGDYRELFAIDREGAEWLAGRTQPLDMDNPYIALKVEDYKEAGGDVHDFVLPHYKPLEFLEENVIYVITAWLLTGPMMVMWTQTNADMSHISIDYILLALGVYIAFCLPEAVQGTINHFCHPDDRHKLLRTGYSQSVSEVMHRLIDLGEDVPYELWARYQAITQAMDDFQWSIDPEKIRAQDDLVVKKIMELHDQIDEYVIVMDKVREQKEECSYQALIEANRVNEDIADNAYMFLDSDYWNQPVVNKEKN